MSHIASCHCGSTRIVLPEHPRQASRCNCTFCQRSGAVWSYYDIGAIVVEKAEHQSSYSTDPTVGLHHFCGKCGMHTWGESLDWSAVYNDDGTPKDNVAPVAMTKCQVNLNLVDDLDWSKIEIEQLDGRNAW